MSDYTITLTDDDIENLSSLLIPRWWKISRGKRAEALAIVRSAQPVGTPKIQATGIGVSKKKMPSPQWRPVPGTTPHDVLSVLSVLDSPATSAEISDAMDKPASHVTPCITQLMRGRYVEQAGRAIGQNGRTRRLYQLTHKGQQCIRGSVTA